MSTVGQSGRGDEASKERKGYFGCVCTGLDE